MTNKNTLLNSDRIKTEATKIGFHKVGIARVDNDYNDGNIEHLQEWLKQGYNADMDWMKNPRRQDIKSCMDDPRSLICLGLNYYTPHQHSDAPEHGKISRYGWGRDYHKVMSSKLKALSNWLQQQREDIKTRFYCDTAPVQDKVWAVRSGIGWIAKNSNVITTDYGSWIFLGSILTNLELKPDRPHTSHCGTCTKCIDRCPTGAIVKPFVVNANLCIAYHTIENRSEKLPKAVSGKLSGWIAGCDICQDVCPWNKRFAKETDVADFQPYPENIKPDLSEIANIDRQEWDKRFRASALRRIKPEMFRRNARDNLEFR